MSFWNLKFSGNGSLDFEEFCIMYIKMFIAEMDSLKASFESFDENGDGKIEVMEFQRALSKMKGEEVAMEEAQLIFVCADRNNDGYINFHGM